MVNDSDEDWTCTVCSSRYSSEVIRGFKRQWVECDGCSKQFHIDYCVPKKHQKDYNLNVDDDEVECICHICITGDDDCQV